MGDTLLREKGSVMMENVEEVKRKSKGKESRFGKLSLAIGSGFQKIGKWG